MLRLNSIIKNNFIHIGCSTICDAILHPGARSVEVQGNEYSYAVLSLEVKLMKGFCISFIRKRSVVYRLAQTVVQELRTAFLIIQIAKFNFEARRRSSCRNNVGRESRNEQKTKPDEQISIIIIIQKSRSCSFKKSFRKCWINNAPWRILSYDYKAISWLTVNKVTIHRIC